MDALLASSRETASEEVDTAKYSRKRRANFDDDDGGGVEEKSENKNSNGDGDATVYRRPNKTQFSGGSWEQDQGKDYDLESMLATRSEMTRISSTMRSKTTAASEADEVVDSVFGYSSGSASYDRSDKLVTAKSKSDGKSYPIWLNTKTSMLVEVDVDAKGRTRPKKHVTSAKGGIEVQGSNTAWNSATGNATGPSDLNGRYNAIPANMESLPPNVQHILNLEPFFGPYTGKLDHDPFANAARLDWSLPESFRDNWFNSDLIINTLMSSYSILGTEVLPIVHTDDLSNTVHEQIEFARGLAGQVDWEMMGRMMTSKRSQKRFKSLRYGLMLLNEWGFYQTERGRAMHILQIKQITMAIQDTVYLMELTALLQTPQTADIPGCKSPTAKSTLKTPAFKDMMDKVFSDWALIQRRPYGLDMMVQGMFERMQLRGVDIDKKQWALLLPSSTRLYAVTQQEHMRFLDTGVPRESFDLEEQLKIRRMSSAVEIQPMPTGAYGEMDNPMYTVTETGSHLVLDGKPADLGALELHTTAQCDGRGFLFKDAGSYVPVTYANACRASFLLSDGTVHPVDGKPVPRGKNKASKFYQAEEKAESTKVESHVPLTTVERAEVARLRGELAHELQPLLHNYANDSDRVAAGVVGMRILSDRYHASAAAKKEPKNFVGKYIQTLNFLYGRAKDKSDLPCEKYPINCSIRDFYDRADTIWSRTDSTWNAAIAPLLGNHAAHFAAYYPVGDSAPIFDAIFQGLAASDQGLTHHKAAAAGRILSALCVALPFDSRWVAFCLAHNVPLHIPIMVARPHVKWNSGCSIMVAKGQETGMCKVGNATCMAGDMPGPQMHEMSVTVCAGAMVLQEKLVLLHKSCFIKGAPFGGGGFEYYDDSAEDKRNYGRGIQNKDAFAFALLPWENESTNWEKLQNIVGCWDRLYVADDKVLYSTSEYYREYWNMRHGEYNALACPVQAQIRHSNTWIPQEKYFTYNAEKKDYSTKHCGTGWYGDWLRDGVLKNFKSFGGHLEPSETLTARIVQGTECS